MKDETVDTIKKVGVWSVVMLLVIMIFAIGDDLLSQEPRVYHPVGINDTCTEGYASNCGYHLNNCTTGTSYSCVGVTMEEKK